MATWNRRKIGRIAAALIAAACFAAAAAFSIFLIGNRIDGYFAFGGQRGYLVADELMNSDAPDALKRGALALFDAGGDFETGIVKGKIVLFRKTIDGVKTIAARRVDRVVVKRLPSGAEITTFALRSDNSDELLPFDVAPNEILGVYVRSSDAAGAFFGFLNGFAGFVVLVLLPAVFGAAAALFLLFSYLRKRT